LNRRIDDVLSEKKLLSRVIPIVVFRGRRLMTAQDVDQVMKEAGIEYARKMGEESAS
jgi:predicted hydrocarbon binding protein